MNTIFSSRKAMMLTGIVAITFQLSLFSGVSHSAGSSEKRFTYSSARINVGINVPESEDNWDDGVGFQVQALFKAQFMPENYDVGFLLGRMNWDANGDNVTLSGSNAVSSALSGDIDVTQLGITVIRSETLQDRLTGTIESSLIYQSVSSDAALNFTYAGGSVISETLEVEDNVALVLGGNLSYKMDDKVNVLFGAAYQIDLSQSEVTAFGTTIDNDSGQFILSFGAEYFY